MFEKSITFLLVLSLLSTKLIGQEYIKGQVIDYNNNPLINASIQWINTDKGVITDQDGYFLISKPNIINPQLSISYIGFQSDTMKISDLITQNLKIQLTPLTNLQSVNVTDNRKNTYIDKEKAIKTEIITQKELTKAACCDLAGCFETQISVEPKTTNIITNTKELSVLGLSGTYNHILLDGIPIINGASYTYGVSAIPGTLIKNIHISQGLASVLQGPESITGQINIILKEHSKEKLFLNLYLNSFLSKQINFDYNFNIGSWKSILSIHSTQPAKEIDNNQDNFLDLPKTTKYSMYNKWTYDNKLKNRIFSSIILRYLQEQRIGGERGFNIEDKGSNLIYGQIINFKQPELLIKGSYKINDNNNIILLSGTSLHQQESYFGTTKYTADQINHSSDVSYMHKWEDHQTTAGLSIKQLQLNENISLNNVYNLSYGGDYLKNEIISGIFLENTFKWNGNIELLTGLRFDYHNEHGSFTTPRALLKYDITENCITRISIGKGWKTKNIFTEHVYLFGSNKDIIISENLKPEEAVNLGVNFLQSFYFDNIEMQLILDYYSTIFSNQIFPDHETDPGTIYIYNFTDQSQSHSFQAELGLEINNFIGIKTAYNYLDVFRFMNNHKHQLPFISKHHILNTISIQPTDKNWQFDSNIHWFGSKKLINTSNNPTEHQRDDKSNPFSMINLQFTKKLPKADLYIGCENILNFTQEEPIISWQDPFSQYFDISNIWGPTKGREFYCGTRITF